MPLPSWSNSQILSELETGSRWYGETISYAFPLVVSDITGPSGEGNSFRPLNDAQQSSAQLAMAVWDDLIAPSVALNGAEGDIRFGLSSTETDYAHSYFPPNGSIWFNATDRDLALPKVGQYSFETFVHEIGHALGLDHMGDYNGPGNNRPSCYQDSSVYSVMSYFGPEHGQGQMQVAWADWVGVDGRTYSPQTPMLNDILAIQDVYGRDETTRVSDTVYGFNSTVSGLVESIYNFDQNAHPILTLYDAGGVDTLDLSGYWTTSEVNLGAGAFSSCNDMTNNIAIAYDCVIENAIGGLGGDVITGNAFGNQLTGGRGNDVLNGADGFDWALYSGQLAGYRVTADANAVVVSDNTVGRDGTDALKSIERLKFTDKNLAFDTIGAAGQGYRLYKAAFDRTPDDAGLGYWINELDHGESLTNVSASFIASKEFADMYGAGSADEHFVTLLYRHVLHRDPDQAGYDYWLGDMAHGQSRASVLMLFSESAENLAQTDNLVVNGIQYQQWVG